MKRFMIIAGVLTFGLMATDFTQLSTEELIAMRGTVPTEEVSAFKLELKSRLQILSKEERQALMKDATATQKRHRSKAMDVLNGDTGSSHNLNDHPGSSHDNGDHSVGDHGDVDHEGGHSGSHGGNHGGGKG